MITNKSSLTFFLSPHLPKKNKECVEGGRKISFHHLWLNEKSSVSGEEAGKTHKKNPLFFVRDQEKKHCNKHAPCFMVWVWSHPQLLFSMLHTHSHTFTQLSFPKHFFSSSRFAGRTETSSGKRKIPQKLMFFRLETFFSCLWVHSTHNHDCWRPKWLKKRTPWENFFFCS